MIIWRIKKVIKKTKTYFEATYKKHHIVIVWNTAYNIGSGCWDITVRMIHKTHETPVYLGHWGNEKYDIDDAIYEAMRGSDLI